MANESSSTHRSVASAGVHRLTIHGYSVAARTWALIQSKPFWVGGYEWAIRYYPNGSANGHPEHTGVYLILTNAADCEEGDHITTAYSFSCLLHDPASATRTTPPEEKMNTATYTTRFNSKQSGFGIGTFMRITDLATLQDDCLVIKCTVEVITKELTYDTGVAVPSSEVTRQLGSLLESGDATDITVDVIGEVKKFRAHRCVLAARSPVFRAMLCGSSMTETKENKICIEDMEAGVFEVLLHYMYHDDLPVFMKEDLSTEEAANMAQHVLVAADRYGVERLKLMCESMLSKTMMDVHTVCSTLGFADRHNCERLKNRCLTYMLKDRERLKIIVKTQGFKQLREKCPSVACEVFEKYLESN